MSENLSQGQKNHLIALALDDLRWAVRDLEQRMGTPGAVEFTGALAHVRQIVEDLERPPSTSKPVFKAP